MSTPVQTRKNAKQLWITLGVLTAGILGGGIAAAALVPTDEVVHPEPYVSPAELPPPAFNRWIRPDTGEFWVPAWDDRRLSDVQKLANPTYNPRWKPFSDCMVAAGFEVREDRSKAFSQADLDEVLHRVNHERPDTSANRGIGSGQKLTGIAGTFLDCADKWLALDRAEFSKSGVRDLGIGEVPEP